jgi:hypothetical protein
MYLFLSERRTLTFGWSVSGFGSERPSFSSFGALLRAAIVIAWDSALCCSFTALNAVGNVRYVDVVAQLR